MVWDLSISLGVFDVFSFWDVAKGQFVKDVSE